MSGGVARYRAAVNIAMPTRKIAGAVKIGRRASDQHQRAEQQQVGIEIHAA